MATDVDALEEHDQGHHRCSSKVREWPGDSTSLAVAIQVVAEPGFEPLERLGEQLASLPQIALERRDTGFQAACPLALLADLRMLHQIPEKSHVCTSFALVRS